MKVFMTMVFGVLNGVLPSPTFNVMHYKRITNIIAYPSYQQKQLLTFMFNLMMVGGLVLEVALMSFTKYNFVIDLKHYVGGTRRKCAIDRPFMLAMLIVQKGTTFT